MLQIRRATPDDFDAILGLILDAARWLGDKGLDQWQKPWPDAAARDARIMRGLSNRQTWVVEDRGRIVATITSKDYGNEKLWFPHEQITSACYISRLVVSREYAGRQLGEALVDWAAARAKYEYGAQAIRIDVWSTNTGLHKYYEESGFTFIRKSDAFEYPSAALFEMKITDSLFARGPHLAETSSAP